MGSRSRIVQFFNCEQKSWDGLKITRIVRKNKTEF